MTKKLVVVGTILLSSCVMTRPISACGDKTSNPARGIWRQLQPLGKQEAILMVLGPDVNKALPYLSEVEAEIRNEGFNLTLVAAPEQITARLKERWDLVIAGPSDVDAAAVAQGPKRILLIAMGASKQQQKEAEKKYSGVVTKVANDYFVEDVANAVEASAKAAKSKKRA